MEGSISYNDLCMLILFLLFFTAGSYFVVTLKRANELVRKLSGMVETNRDHIEKSVRNLHLITENSAEISSEAKESVGRVSKAVDVISQDTTETVLTINKTAEEIGTYAVVIGEIAKSVANLFSPGRK